MSKRNDDIDSKIFKSTVAVIVFSILTIIGGIIAWPTLIFTVPFIAFQIWLLVNEIRERDKMNK